MTRSTNMEHVAHLQRMANESWIGSPERAALDAAIASLSAPQSDSEWVLVPKDAIERAIETLENDGDEHGEGRNLRAMLDAAPQPPAEAQPVGGGEVFGWVLGDAFVDARFWTAGTPPQGWTPVYRTAPPSAPVGVEAMMAVAEKAWNEHQTACRFTTVSGSLKKVCEALAQQPAADGGFSAADMMDARQEGRKEAQQLAAVDTSWLLPILDAAAQGKSVAMAAGDAARRIRAGQQPAAVDAVEEALQRWLNWCDEHGEQPEAASGARIALTAALSAQQGGRSDD